ncbi:MAG: DNA/RNA nuclease SfsA [Bdellovibrionaceae bacterium]|nr:DNA/RNA nuclease SfsA [Pseudobdellovibrionaceae bacterium]
MELPKPLVEGRFIKRYKRFFADICLNSTNSETVTAHVPNTGSLQTCLNDQAPCLCSFNDDPKRKLKYTLQAIKTPTSWVGVNTSLTNDLVWEAWNNQWFSQWQGFPYGKREVKVSEGTRFDMVFWEKDLQINILKKIPLEIFDKHPFHFVEVKNVSMAKSGTAYFPDAVTTRGQKHLRELMFWVKKGHTAEIVFVIQRTDCDQFAPAIDIDPEYARLLKLALNKGVRVSPYACEISESNIQLDFKRKLRLLI